VPDVKAKELQKKKKKSLKPNFKHFNSKKVIKTILIHAEISVYPMGTSTTSASFYIAKAIESIQNMEGIRYEINPMGTVLESDNIDKIYDASKSIMEVVHNLGVSRVEVILKIDSRRDKDKKMEEKLESIKKYLEK
jgi:uncharacterized protein (TIGR00106 family)